MNSNAALAARQLVAQRLADAQRLATLLVEATQVIIDHDAARLPLVDQRNRLIAGLAHFGSDELAAELGGVSLAEIRRLKRQHPAAETADNVAAFEARPRPRKRRVKTADPVTASPEVVPADVIEHTAPAASWGAPS